MSPSENALPGVCFSTNDAFLHATWDCAYKPLFMCPNPGCLEAFGTLEETLAHA
eukprot:CAMPEP_0169185266 /NCGR_PEP_ID=MMETSP1016-20121227/1693_1 /TAXON_ID=342587 /ORGANISM="Karlodinium micrum, Strain CCMP2283" /LENGTH=53 /DNA_ID=CAMNT_0009260935 /DNA_START=314 /DNA_END=471 /DNA_ORIENTATION=-